MPFSCNKKISVIVGITTFFLSFVLIPVFAETSTSSTQGENKHVCSQIGASALKFNESIINQVDQLEMARSEQLSTLAGRRSMQDIKKAKARAETDAVRAREFAQLQMKALTPKQKQSVETFRSAIYSAIAAGRNTIDTSTKIFRDGLDSALASQKIAVDTAISTYNTAVQKNIHKAQSECTKKVAVNKIRSTLQGELDTARKAFQETQRSIINTGDIAQSLAKSHEDAITQTEKNFIDAIEKAHIEIKDIFASTTQSH